MNTLPTQRVQSIDVLRALTMLLMIFVNDLWSLRGIPLWLEHTAAEADGMGLADTVFPAFLFIVGMSIPLSVQQRRAKGEGSRLIVRHILERSIALLVMGVFLVNGETINEAATGLRSGTWYMLCCSCFIVIWNSWPKRLSYWQRWNIKGLGIIALCVLAWMYRGGGEDNLGRFSPQWWGILGLIGWAYLSTALIYVATGRHRWITFVAWAIFLSLCMASHAGRLPDNPLLRNIIGPLGDGAMPAFTMGGTVMTLLLLHFRQEKKEGQMLVVFLAIAVALLLAGFYTRSFWGISKIRATPAWVLICSAITIAVFLPIYWLVDRWGKGDWFKVIRPAGTNTLLCYLLPYFAYGLAGVFALALPAILLTGIIGLVKSLLFALLMVVTAGWLGRVGVRLKL